MANNHEVNDEGLDVWSNINFDDEDSVVGSGHDNEHLAATSNGAIANNNQPEADKSFPALPNPGSKYKKNRRNRSSLSAPPVLTSGQIGPVDPPAQTDGASNNPRGQNIPVLPLGQIPHVDPPAQTAPVPTPPAQAGQLLRRSSVRRHGAPYNRGDGQRQAWDRHRAAQSYFNAQARLVDLLYHMSNPFRGRGRGRGYTNYDDSEN